jgi:hypothetical protein
LLHSGATLQRAFAVFDGLLARQYVLSGQKTPASLDVGSLQLHFSMFCVYPKRLTQVPGTLPFGARKQRSYSPYPLDSKHQFSPEHVGPLPSTREQMQVSAFFLTPSL